MATVIKDTLEDVSSEWSRDTIQSLTRSVLVHGLTSAAHTVHSEVITALEAASPSLGYGTIPADYTNLILMRHKIRAAEDPTICRVLLEYDSKDRARINWTIRGRSSLTQITSRVDRGGFPITVTHNGISQGGEINVSYPQTVIYAANIVEDETPWIKAHLWEGRVNSRPWGGAGAGRVMITDVQFDSVDLSADPPTWYFELEISFDLTGWQPEVWWTDPTTGKPGVGMTPGVGYKTVGWYPTFDFAEIFQLNA